MRRQEQLASAEAVSRRLCIAVRRHRETIATVALGVCLTLVVGGCRPSHERQVAPVSGVVTLDGSPLTSGNVIVIPSSGRTSRGKIGPEGTFRLGTYSDHDGAPVGTHPVTVTPVPVDEGGTWDAQAAIPGKYRSAKTSGLSVTIESGESNDLNLTLVSEQ